MTMNILALSFQIIISSVSLKLLYYCYKYYVVIHLKAYYSARNANYSVLILKLVEIKKNIMMMLMFFTFRHFYGSLIFYLQLQPVPISLAVYMSQLEPVWKTVVCATNTDVL